MTRPQVTPEMEAAIREGHAAGRSLNSIARQLDVNPSTVSRWCKKAGLIWTGVPHASDVVRERLAFNRLVLAEAALADAIAIRERLWEPHEVIVNTPEGPKPMTLDLPDAKATAEYAAAIERLIKSHAVMSDFKDTQGVDHAKSMLGRLQAAIAEMVEEEPEEPPTPTEEELDSEADEVTTP